MNVRLLTISGKFPAKAELEALLQAYARTWPGANGKYHRVSPALRPDQGTP